MMKTVSGVYWPGSAKTRKTSQWDELRTAIAAMEFDGVIEVSLETDEEIDRVRKGAQEFAFHTLQAKKGGWRLRSTRRGKSLFLKKERITTSN